MKKAFALSIFLSIIIITIISLYPRKVENAIIIDSTKGHQIVYIDNKTKKVNIGNVNFTKYDVISFSYNMFTTYNISKLSPITERIMTKNNDFFDLESSGDVRLSKNVHYYKIDKNNNISLCSGDNLIVGKNNVKAFKDSKGTLKSFLIYPLDYSTMRVAISSTNFTSIYHEKIKLISKSDIKIFGLKDKFSVTIPKNTVIDIDKNNDVTNITSTSFTKDTKERIYILGDSITISSITRGSPTFYPSYSGTLEVSNHDNGLLLINEVSMEDYLTKVVPSEMPASSAIEALKCQAIAARTYAISDMLINRFANLGFYVDDSTQSQVYNNILPQTKTNEAVKSTKGIVITYKGVPIDAKYYSSSAGTSATYNDIWFESNGTSINKPYFTTESYISDTSSLPKTEEDWLNFYKATSLTGIDSDSPYFRWHAQFNKSALESSLNKSLSLLFEKKKDYMVIKKGKKKINTLPSLENLLDIKVVKRSTAGNIITISFIFENATVDVSQDSNIRSAIKCSEDFAGTQIPIVLKMGTVLNKSSSLLSSFFSIEKVNDTYVFYGGGYGHGVGMSQYAAMDLGRSGMNYEDILKKFYKDISMTQMY